MERAERVCRFCKRPLTSATSAKRVNSVPVFSATKNKDLLVPGQENLVLTDAFQLTLDMNSCIPSPQFPFSFRPIPTRRPVHRLGLSGEERRLISRTASGNRA